jgi:hypothetical protein
LSPRRAAIRREGGCPWWTLTIEDAQRVAELVVCDLRGASRRYAMLAIPEPAGCSAIEAAAVRLSVRLQSHHAILVNKLAKAWAG